MQIQTIKYCKYGDIVCNSSCQLGRFFDNYCGFNFNDETQLQSAVDQYNKLSFSAYFNRINCGDKENGKTEYGYISVG